MSDSARQHKTPLHHLNALTGIRGIAAWLVVLFHVRVTLVHSLPGWALAVIDKGYLAVDLFFILSGFVLWYNYGERLRGTGFGGAVSFWWRRVARIWPLHACLLGAFLLLVAVLAATGRDISAYPLAELPLHVVLIQNWGFTPALAWNDPAWSISCEMGAYLAFPLVVALGRWDRLASWVLVALGIGLLVAIWQFFALFDANCLGVMIATTGLVRCLLEFALGNILCLLWLRWRDVPSAALRAMMTSAAALEAGVLGNLPETMFVPLCFAGLIMALAIDQGPLTRLIAGRVLTYLGEISYSTYLSHVLLFILFKLAFVDSTQLVSLPKLMAFMALVAGASVILYHGVEKPAQAWLNGWAPGLPRRARAI